MSPTDPPPALDEAVVDAVDATAADAPEPEPAPAADAPEPAPEVPAAPAVAPEDAPKILRGSYVVLDGAGLSRCWARVLAAPEHNARGSYLEVAVVSVRERVRLDPRRPPRMVVGGLLVAITSRRSVQSRPRRTGSE